MARQKERASTIGGVLTATLKSATWLIAIGMALGEFGFDLGPLIASAGIVGVEIEAALKGELWSYLEMAANSLVNQPD